MKTLRFLYFTANDRVIRDQLSLGARNMFNCSTAVVVQIYDQINYTIIVVTHRRMLCFFWIRSEKMSCSTKTESCFSTCLMATKRIVGRSASLASFLFPMRNSLTVATGMHLTIWTSFRIWCPHGLAEEQASKPRLSYRKVTERSPLAIRKTTVADHREGNFCGAQADFPWVNFSTNCHNVLNGTVENTRKCLPGSCP